MALIPARSGSKGIPHKNIKPIHGKPLIVYSIEQALHSKLINRTIVSTDSKKYAEIAVKYGAEVPFLRPKNLSKDETPDLPVYQHALQYLNTIEGYKPDYVVWLRPTTPLRSIDDIDNAISLAIESKADCVRSVCLVEHHPFWMKMIEDDRLVPFISGKDEKTFFRRQLLPKVYRINGAVDVFNAFKIKKETLYSGDIKGYIMPKERSLDIDTELDFLIIELLIERSLSR